MAPIVVIYEKWAGPVDNSSIAIRVYSDLKKMKIGKYSQEMSVPKSCDQIDPLEMGSPNIEYMKWSGNIHTSKFTITFEYQD
jgi:hypothetical protein